MLMIADGNSEIVGVGESVAFGEEVAVGVEDGAVVGRGVDAALART